METPQFEAAKTVIRVRWLFTEEIFLIYSFRVYDVAMDPLSRVFYKEWREWLRGNSKYDCNVKKPRRLSRLYSKAVRVVCFDREEKEWKLREALERVPRRRRYKRWTKPRPRRERANLYDLVEKFEKLK